MNRRDEKVVREVSLRQLFEANLVIPEIQREYVWGDPEIGKRVLEPFYEDFLKSVQEYANKREQVAARTKSLSEHLQKSLDEFGIFDVGNARLNDFSILSCKTWTWRKARKLIQRSVSFTRTFQDLQKV